MALPDMRPEDRTFDEMNDLLNILDDAADNFEEGAEHVEDAEVGNLLQTYAAMFKQYGGEIGNMIVALGGTVDTDIDVGDDLRELWINVRAAFSGDDTHVVLAEAEKVADKIVDGYEDVLAGDLTAEARRSIDEQYDEIERMHDRIRTLRDAAD